ncbi:hypothetical protein BGX21_005056 [Mortierella sp. AD011]|nr:hypothetical protein BGX21_005056 [Mortierella sp. AD011]
MAEQKAAHSSDRKKNKKKKSSNKKSINQILGIGKPGPHLLKHNKLKEAQKAKKAISKANMGESGSMRETSATPRSSTQHSRQTPQHHHHVLDHVAHTGTYLDEYDQDLQYQYSPGLWQNSSHANNPEDSNEGRARAIRDNIYQRQFRNSVERQSTRTTSVPAVPTAPGPEPVLISIPSMEDLRNIHLEKIKERNERLKNRKLKNTGAEVERLRLNRSKGGELRGQDALRHISRLRNTTDDLQQDEFEGGSDFIRLDAETPALTFPSGTVGTLKKKRYHEDGGDTQGCTGPPPGCPWMQHRQYPIAPSAPLLLNHEVKDFVAFISPTQEEHQVRIYVYERVKGAIKALWGDVVVKLFGSFETQLYLPTSDLDIVIFREDAFLRDELKSLATHLQRTKVGSDFEIIPDAKVPLVKFKESISDISVDISFNVFNGVDGATLIKRFMEDTPGLRSLTILVKHFLKLKRINEPFYGGIGSFLTVIMVLSFLQMHPKVQGKWIDPEENLGVLLIEFFELYGLNFNYKNVGLTVADGGRYFLKKDGNKENEKGLCFHALDPNNPNNNVGHAAKKIDSARVYFATAFDSLVFAVEERDRYLRKSGYNANAPKVSLIKGVLSIPQKMMKHRFHIETVYNAGTFKQVLSR